MCLYLCASLFLSTCRRADFWFFYLHPFWSLLRRSKGCIKVCHERRAGKGYLLCLWQITDDGLLIMKSRSSRKNTFLSRWSKPWWGPCEPKSTICCSQTTDRQRTSVELTCSPTSRFLVGKIKITKAKPTEPL